MNVSWTRASSSSLRLYRSSSSLIRRITGTTPVNLLSSDHGAMKLTLYSRTTTTATAVIFASITQARAFSFQNNISIRAPVRNMSTNHMNLHLVTSVEESLDNSWIQQLSPETDENLAKSRKIERLSERDDNRSKRPVFSGHYVLVKPTGLRKPRLVLHSKDVADELKLSETQISSQEFLQWVSGNLLIGDGDKGEGSAKGWATPYALSINGSRLTSNCPYGTGVGYGDGRAISIAEFNGKELQLKGAGKTPFCRGADGRAVLRSSIREFLASEAMHYLGIRTTRALSLVVSDADTVNRPWYTENVKNDVPSLDDPRLADYSLEQKKALIAQLRTRKADPNVMIQEKCAITCRVAPSFTRVGHLDLHARRAKKSNYDQSTLAWKELQEMVWHACFREFKQEAYDPFIEENDIAGAATKLLELSADRLSDMVSDWCRVGFAQGNFNADNCLVGGHTMDYGPFGWMDEYSPLFAKWTGSGEHFGFLNQPSAGFANYQILVESVLPVIIGASSQISQEDSQTILPDLLELGQKLFQRKLDETWRIKLGLSKENEGGDDLWERLEPLLRQSRVDWTLFWRQLSYVADQFKSDSTDYEGMLAVLIGNETGESSPFYEPLTPAFRNDYLTWIEAWRDALKEEGLPEVGAPSVGERMKQVNPKYVLREWMLVDAYSDAADGDETNLKELFALIQRPYDEGTAKEQSNYYVRAELAALTSGGTAFMS